MKWRACSTAAGCVLLYISYMITLYERLLARFPRKD